MLIGTCRLIEYISSKEGVEWVTMGVRNDKFRKVVNIDKSTPGHL